MAPQGSWSGERKEADWGAVDSCAFIIVLFQQGWGHVSQPKPKPPGSWMEAPPRCTLILRQPYRGRRTVNTFTWSHEDPLGRALRYRSVSRTDHALSPREAQTVA